MDGAGLVADAAMSRAVSAGTAPLVTSRQEPQEPQQLRTVDDVLHYLYHGNVLGCASSSRCVSQFA